MILMQLYMQNNCAINVVNIAAIPLHITGAYAGPY